LYQRKPKMASFTTNNETVLREAQIRL